MKKILLSMLSVSSIILLFSSFVININDVYTVDTSSSKIHWLGKNVAGGTHTGTISLQKGSFSFDGSKLTGGEFTIDLKTIAVTDLTGSRAERLENHLKSEDFFEIEKHPSAQFKITKIDGQGTNITITGDLTIKGITNPITFPATIKQTGSTVSASAKDVKFDRTHFDVKYRSGNFFSGLGDRAISDEITIDIEILAKK